MLKHFKIFRIIKDEWFYLFCYKIHWWINNIQNFQIWISSFFTKNHEKWNIHITTITINNSKWWNFFKLLQVKRQTYGKDFGVVLLQILFALLLSFTLFSLDYTLVTKIINREQKLGYYQQHGADKSKHLYQI